MNGHHPAAQIENLKDYHQPTFSSDASMIAMFIEEADNAYSGEVDVPPCGCASISPKSTTAKSNETHGASHSRAE
jgi:hypothetical protein